MVKPTSTLELLAFYPEALNLASPWLVSGLISTEEELIALTLKYHATISGDDSNEQSSNNPTILTEASERKSG